MKIASEPCRGREERDRFLFTQCSGVRGLPAIPEGIVAGTGVEEHGEFIDVVHDPVAQKQVAEDVEAEVSEVIDGIEREELHSGEVTLHAAIPEAICLGKSEKGDLFIP